MKKPSEHKKSALMQEYRESKMRMEIIENKLNHCDQDEVDELSYELIAEQKRFARIKRELTELYRQHHQPVA